MTIPSRSSSEAAPICPVCGSRMTLRVAKTGARAGNQFWGCSRFPVCRGIVDIAAAPGATPELGPIRDSATADFRLRQVWADPARRGRWSSFFTTSGGRLRSWDPFGNPERTPTSPTSLSHAAYYLSGDVRAQPVDSVVIDILRRLLARGDRPPVDPIVERWVLEQTGLWATTRKNRDPGDLAVRLDPQAALPSPVETAATAAWREAFEFDPSARRADGHSVLEPGLEDRFLLELVPAAAGAQAGHWVIPQAPMAPLLGSTRDDRRVDFLVSIPAQPPMVVELDGAAHEASREVDRDRDHALAAAGIAVTRFDSADLQEAEILTEIRTLFRGLPSTPPARRDALLIWGAAAAHRIFRAVVEAMAAGWLSGPTWTIALNEPLGVGRVAFQSALETIAAVAEVWNERLAPDRVEVRSGQDSFAVRRIGVTEYAIEPAGVSGPPDVRLDIDLFLGPWHRLPDMDTSPVIVVRSTHLPIQIREGRLEGGERRVVPDPDRIDPEALERLLSGIFAKREFYPADAPHPRGQEIAIRRVLGGRDTAVLLPTGAGKSLIYQFAGLLLPGRTLIIDPIVALIDDQLDGLARQGIDRGLGITSGDTAAGRTEAKLGAVAAGDALFFYVAPERLQQRLFRDAVRALTVASPINLCVVDEAHCVSEWGHDFRTSYLDIGRVLREVSADTRGSAPPILALTGTASRAVLRDMLIELDVDRSDPASIVAPQDFDRPELTFDVVKSGEDEVLARLVGSVRALPARFRVTEAEFFRANGPDTYGGIVFTQTVNPTKRTPDLGVVKLQQRLAEETGAPVGMYSGSRPRAWAGNNWDVAKRAEAQAFKNNELTMLIATKAYGMGIDKPNIRYTVHLGVPSSIEAFYQEAGRAGRDRQPARCLIVHDPLDREFHDFTNAGSFKGVDVDATSVSRTIDLIGEIGVRRTVQIPRSRMDDAAEDEERAIHRLKLLGIVRDYLVDWGSSKYELMLGQIDVAGTDARLLAYIRRTQPGRVRAFERELAADPTSDLAGRVRVNARRLIAFIYETVVQSRRRALDEMVRLADDAKSDREIRDRILRYLELGKVAGELEQLVDVAPFSFEPWQALLLQLDTVDDAREWRGATARFLESAPDHPGLLAGRALAEAVVPDGNLPTFAENLSAALSSAGPGYSASSEEVAEFAEWSLEWLHERQPRWAAVGYLIAERLLGDGHLGRFDALERRVLSDHRTWHADELAVISARRLDRHLERLSTLAGMARELT